MFHCMLQTINCTTDCYVSRTACVAIVKRLFWALQMYNLEANTKTKTKQKVLLNINKDNESLSLGVAVKSETSWLPKFNFILVSFLLFYLLLLKQNWQLLTFLKHLFRAFSLVGEIYLPHPFYHMKRFKSVFTPAL